MLGDFILRNCVVVEMRSAPIGSLHAMAGRALGLTVALVVLSGCEETGAIRGDGGRSPSRVDSGSAFDGMDAGRLIPLRDGGVQTGLPDAFRVPADADFSQRQYVELDECSTNSAGLSVEEVQALIAGGQPDAFRIVYPYSETVFPRNMLAPDIMWDGSPGQAVYVHISSEFVDYYGCLTTTGPGYVTIPQYAWDLAGQQTGGPSTPFTISVTVMDNGRVTGTSAVTVTIAQASLKGSIFYNSYTGLGAVYRIQPGGMAQPFLNFGCTGCHSLSANGARLSSSVLATGSAYTITPDSAPNPAPVMSYPIGMAFPAFTPDGALILSTGVRAGGPATYGALGAADANAELRVTDTGMVVPNTGIPPAALMPSFSPTGTLLTFNDFDQSGGHSIALMDFDVGSRSATNKRIIYSDPDPLHYPGWPFVLPDNRAVIFSRTTTTAHTGNGAGVIPGVSAFGEPESDLYIADLTTGQSTMLRRAMGFDASGNPYVPYGDQDLHHHYYPTVSPVAAGGYFWVFFDSIRNYGHRGRYRQLWGAAVRVAPDEFGYELDPSYPPFYLTGQAFAAGNHRAFTALDPCRENGQGCETGIDCCSGFCTDGVCDLPARCSLTDEACTEDSDCCDPMNSCIPPGFCGIILL